MPNINDQLYEAFTEIADLMALLDENSFKIRAYQEAARRLKQEVKPLTKKDTNKIRLKEIPGVGDAIAEKIIQFIKTGKIDYLEKLRKEIPKPVRDMLKIPHLGPRRVRDLYINLNIKSTEDLMKAAKSGKIQELRGFGEKLVGQILQSIELGQEKKKRHPRADVEPIARKLIAFLKKIRGVKRAEVAGSYRRQAPDVGDLDLLTEIDPKIFKPITDATLEKIFPEINILGAGETKTSFVIFPENLQVDIRFVAPESYGAALLYFTGNKDYNVMMRKVAIGKGYLLNEYGLFKDGEYMAGKTEKEVYKKLGLPWREPKERQG